jgi:multiple sugar transport system permease protein
MSRRSQVPAAMCFLLPNFSGFLVFVAGPILFSFVVAFTNWDLQRTVPFQWVGLENFRNLWNDEKFWLYLVNTIYLMLGIPFSIVGSLALAMLLNQKLRGAVVFRTLYYLPTFTSGVALLILWKALYNPNFGPINAAINQLLSWLSIDSVTAPKWLISTQNLFGLDIEHVGFSSRQFGLGARDAIVMMGTWLAIGGSNMLLYIAALSNVPVELEEAAQIDGAGRWATFRHITWPHLAPVTFFIVVMSFIGGLQGGFEQARVLTGGGPAGTTTTLSYYIYTKAFEECQIGYASAVAWVLFAFIMVLTLIGWKFGSASESSAE